jgi:hypothetical protein
MLVEAGPLVSDGGGFGRSYNRLHWSHLQQTGQSPHLYSIFYSATDQDPMRDGLLWNWTVNRSAIIGTLFGRIKKQLLRFPSIQ